MKGHHIETRHVDAGILADILRSLWERVASPTARFEALEEMAEHEILSERQVEQITHILSREDREDRDDGSPEWQRRDMQASQCS